MVVEWKVQWKFNWAIAIELAIELAMEANLLIFDQGVALIQTLKMIFDKSLNPVRPKSL